MAQTPIGNHATTGAEPGTVALQTLALTAQAIQAQIAGDRSPSSLEAGPDRPAPKTAIAALKQVEKATRRDRQDWPEAGLVGTWRLSLVAPKAAGNGDRGFYFPQWVPAKISFLSDPTEGADGAIARITNSVTLGPAVLEFAGPARWVGRRNLLAFDFVELSIRLFDRTLYRGPVRGDRPATKALSQQPFPVRAVGSLPFFAFCWVTEQGIAARGRSGGLALWVRDQS
ncbi:MAG: hypothetical protein EA001_03225 [Oscillatoriales cyanobacterium]|nr:MAG: hypothetical protein EA001_03225 [Oscillatoriales cyanobacterium]